MNKQLIPSLLMLAWALTIGCSTDRTDQPASNQFMRVSEALRVIVKTDDTEKRMNLVDTFWKSIKDTAMIPYTLEDTAIFLYRGEAGEVSWNGDFNSWGGDRQFDNEGKRIDSTDLWYLIKKFPEDARLDYKITLDGNRWILDPNNPNQQWSGFGPNSELRMPEWQEAFYTNVDKKGTIDSFTINSNNLNYDVAYKVYKPFNYETHTNLPVLYVTDGHEYVDSRLGQIIKVADHLVASEEVIPFMMVLIDPRNPADQSANRRQQEYTINSNYLSFVVDELVPMMDNQHKTAVNERGILGTSLGGLNASYFGAEKPAIFNLVAIQSPAYWYKTSIYDQVENATQQPEKVIITAGTFNDGLANARKMEVIYKNEGITPVFIEVNEGHSWGAWSQQLDDILIYLFPKN